jgi:drug/metabolite transporter (DMT)-like permease
VDYSALFWGEKDVASGVAAILAATIPLMTVGLEIFPFRTQPFRWIVLGSSMLGFVGVAVLMLPGSKDGIALVPSVAILLGSVGWSVGTILQQRMVLPASRAITSAGTMMLGGAILLALSAAFGELRPFPHISMRGALALVYLFFGGSLMGFTAYVWLLGRLPASKVASYAYVNPLVAVVVGYFLAKEPVTMRMVIGMAMVLVSVFLTLKAKSTVQVKA